MVAFSFYYEVIYITGDHFPFFTFVSLYYLVFHGIFPYYAELNVPHLPFNGEASVESVVFTFLFISFQFAGYFFASRFLPIQGHATPVGSITALKFVSWALIAGYFVIYFILSYSAVPSLPQLKVPCWYFGFSTLLYLIFERKLLRLHIAALILVFLSKTSIDIVDGFLTPIIFDLVIVMSVALCLKKHKRTILLCIVGATLFFSYGYIKHFSRGYVNGGVAHIYNFKPELLFSNLGASFDAAARRSAHLLITSHVMERTPGVVPFEDRNPFFDAALNHIPRVFWRSKPKEIHGNSFGRRYGILNKDDMESSWNLPWTVDFFMTLGPVFSVVSIFIVGGIFGLFVRLMSSNAERPFWFGVYSATLFPLFYQESNFSVMSGSVGSVLIFLLSTYWMAKKIFPPQGPI